MEINFVVTKIYTLLMNMISKRQGRQWLVNNCIILRLKAGKKPF